MSIYASYSHERAVALCNMLDALVDLLDNVYYDRNIDPVLLKEAEIYEYASDYLPGFVPDLDRFFRMIHQSLRHRLPPDSADVDAHINSIREHVDRMDDYADLYHKIYDEYSRRTRETAVTSYHDTNISRIMRGALGYESVLELPDNTDDYDEAIEKIRDVVAERFRERKKQRIQAILSYLECQNQPCTFAEMQSAGIRVSWPIIRLLLGQKKIIRYTGERFFLVSKLYVSETEKSELIQAIENCFILENILNCHEVYRMISNDFKELFQRLHINTANSMLNVFAAIIPDAFVYKQPKIALPGEVIPEPVENIVRFLKNRYQTKVIELREYIDTMEYDIPINMQILTNLQGIFLLNHETLISASKIDLTEEQEKRIISLITDELEKRESEEGEALPIRNLRCMVNFPAIEYPWDEWLLYCLIKKINDPTLHAFYTTARYSVAIPIVSLHQEVSPETKKMIMKDLKGKEYDSSRLKTINSDNLDELFDEELEEEWLMEDIDD